MENDKDDINAQMLKMVYDGLRGESKLAAFGSILLILFSPLFMFMATFAFLSVIVIFTGIGMLVGVFFIAFILVELIVDALRYMASGIKNFSNNER